MKIIMEGYNKSVMPKNAEIYFRDQPWDSNRFIMKINMNRNCCRTFGRTARILSYFVALNACTSGNTYDLQSDFFAAHLETD